MNTYSKYAPNVFLAKCTEQHKKGSTIQVTTKRHKENECIVFNLIYEKDGFFYYSIVRADGYNAQTRAQNKAAKYTAWASSAENKSGDYYVRSNKDRDFLILGEPIKIGHHSEKRHRKLIEQANYNMGKSVEFSNKAAAHESKASYWEGKTDIINLSMPESVDYYTYELEKAKSYHHGLKSGAIPRDHSMSLQYANKKVKDLENNVRLAKLLWL